MSVLVTLRIEANAGSLENEDPAVLLGVLDRGKSFGVMSHHFYATDNELMVIDEWPDEDSFRRFFESSPEIPEIMARAGVTTEPEIKFWRHLDTPDALG